MNRSKVLLSILMLFELNSLSQGINYDHFDKIGRQLDNILISVHEDKLLISIYETWNELYSYFLKSDLAIENKDIVRVDSLGWFNHYLDIAPMDTRYHLGEEYKYYPVVNISYRAAIIFCHWLTQLYMMDKRRKYENVIFRLPTKNEWEQAANLGDTNRIFSWSDSVLFNPDSIPYGQFKQSTTWYYYSRSDERWSFTCPVYAHFCSANGIYNLCGNVAEMTLDSSSTKGGSWWSEYEYLKINGPDEYYGWQHPSPYIGFRFVCEVIYK